MFLVTIHQENFTRDVDMIDKLKAREIITLFDKEDEKYDETVKKLYDIVRTEQNLPGHLHLTWRLVY